MPDITIAVSNALDNKITAKWGTTLAWKRWVKEETKRLILNDTLRQIEADAQVAAQAQRDAALAADAGL